MMDGTLLNCLNRWLEGGGEWGMEVGAMEVYIIEGWGGEEVYLLHV